MRPKRWTGYEGLVLYIMGEQWRLSISRKIDRQWQSLNADMLFLDLDFLRGKLQLGDVMAISVALSEDGHTCLIKTAKRHGVIRVEGLQIIKVLERFYPAHGGIPIRWRQDIRRH